MLAAIIGIPLFILVAIIAGQLDKNKRQREFNKNFEREMARREVR